jgi:hypothetical protein
MNMRRISLLTITIMLCVVRSGIAAVPGSINYQGYLTDTGGNPVADGGYDITFTIYDSATAGNSKWTEDRTVTTSDGLFSVLLGSLTQIPDSVFNSDERYLGIKLRGDPELVPRTRLVTASYSFHAAKADTAEYALASAGAGSGGWTKNGNIVHLTDPDDTVGIGTSTPTTKLEVAGHARITGKLAIGPGSVNTGFYAFVAGNDNSVTGNYSTIPGGSYNSSTGGSAVISGGNSNSAEGSNTVIGGGLANAALGFNSTVSGGQLDSAIGYMSYVGGGFNNVAGDTASAVVGGWGNHANGFRSFVGGGIVNFANGRHSVIGGGWTNVAEGHSSVVGGGANDSAIGDWSVVGGGYQNKAIGTNSVVGGGGGETASDGNMAFGIASTVSGGQRNLAEGALSVVSGGRGNGAYDSSVVCGGIGNHATGYLSVVGGGKNNLAADSACVVGGGIADTARGEGATVAGGKMNVANGIGCTVSGGESNIAHLSYSTIGGGMQNSAGEFYATVGGGYNNGATDYAVVSGGAGNVAGGHGSMVPGGVENVAYAEYALAAGFRAKTRYSGSFIWSDYSSLDSFYTTGNNQFLIRADGGVGINTNSPEVPLHVEGGSDVSLGGGGYFMTGPVTGSNVAMDNNEIMARNNGAASTLYLNTNGGNISIAPSGAGNVGIGLTSPTNILHVKQFTSLDPIADAWTIYSSRRWKMDIRPIDNALDLVGKLEGVRYRWKRDGTADIGLIAEDVGKVIPEVVEYEANGIDATSVDYSRLVPLLIESIKEQQSTISEQSQDIGDLRNEVAKLKELVTKMTARAKIDKSTQYGLK